MEGRFESNWEAVFEPEDYLYFYEDMLTDEQTQIEVDFIRRELDLKDPKKILDMACGYGRHANRLALYGHEVVGVDISEKFLEMAMKEAEKLNVNVRYVLKDIREIDFEEEFDVVISMFTSFGYYEDEDNLKILKNVAKALKRGGKFLLDLSNRDFILRNFLPYVVIEREGNYMIDFNIVDITEGRIYNKRVVIRDGVKKEKPFFIRLYAPTEIKFILESLGLKVIKFFGGYDSSPLSIYSRRMIIISEKV
ncbi:MULTISPECIES: class I SAM-dependent methyltransferase [Dictyoglomus]|uniref:Methyltransferase type 11 n=1 Tax=Dictyoglomus turgidum (strain DSM 6724 / Z-1310) TaxID=515635 RepID=B8DYX4_DICTD|nr:MULTISPECIES: class I SAM-dependent methyltransferase [Dictyoglomus]ACK41600.1 Methyltransferase type 11 [Dictyoglomus turgidum DSM 6724]HBU31681.1 class I SAM-dependent methyltransferase [Dictyoglomus sp.]